MTCHIVQPQQGKNAGERDMFSFLKNMPEDYTLYSELKINVGYKDQVEHLEQKQPDFVVVGNDIGIVSIEVKDWNLLNNIYEWKNQFALNKYDARTGKLITDDIDAPHVQVEAYKWGLKALLEDLPSHIKSSVRVTSLLAFPRLTKAEFLNGVMNSAVLKDKQAKFYFESRETIFKEDLDKYSRNPQKLVLEFVKKHHPGIKELDGKALYISNSLLMPPKCKVGGNVKLQKARQKILTLSHQQMQWAFSLDPAENYLLDVAGSGKTNAILSKAIHNIDIAEGSKPSILITTYSPDLERSLTKMFNEKVGEEANLKYTGIKVLSIHSLVDLIVRKVYTDSDIEAMINDSDSVDQRLSKLIEVAREIIQTEPEPEKFMLFDFIFIDEIQDFSNEYLRLIKKTSRGEKYFFVGDIGQKLYDRHYDLQKLGLSFNRKALESSYVMYRTPKYIAELATKFIMNDSSMQAEFREYGYSENFSFANDLDVGAEISKTSTPEEDVAMKIKDLLETQYIGGEHQILVITSEPRIKDAISALERLGIPCQFGERVSEGGVTIVEFTNSKGLEREVVLMLGLEDLYHPSNPSALLDSPREKVAGNGYSRRKIYVALTRATEKLILYYSDPTHPFISELCSLNETINNKRMNIT